MNIATGATARWLAAATLALLAAGCVQTTVRGGAGYGTLADRAAIEATLSRANRGFELSDPELFAGAFATDAVFTLNGTGPVFGYDKMVYKGRAEIRRIIDDRVDKARRADPKTLSYDPATLRRYNRNSDSLIELIDATHARHTSTWMVVMKTNVDIHTSAIGRYEDKLEKRGAEWLLVERQRIE